MLENLPYKEDDDLLWKVEKAIELMEEDEVGPLNLLNDLKTLKRMADNYIDISIALDDFSEVKGRPRYIEDPVFDSRSWFFVGFHKVKFALKELLCEFERCDF